MGAARVPHLTLLSPPQEPPRGRLAAPARRLSLAGSPFRPGELPSPIELQLSEDSASTAVKGARGCGVPVELWLRAAFEGALALERLQLHAPRARVEHELDARAREPAKLTPLDSRLGAYAQLLRRGEPASVTRTRGGRVELLVPAELALSWRREAALAGAGLDAWAQSLLERAPAQALRWEAAAAEAGAGLREWAYACSLALIACASA